MNILEHDQEISMIPQIQTDQIILHLEGLLKTDWTYNPDLEYKTRKFCGFIFKQCIITYL